MLLLTPISRKKYQDGIGKLLFIFSWFVAQTMLYWCLTARMYVHVLISIIDQKAVGMIWWWQCVYQTLWRHLRISVWWLLGCLGIWTLCSTILFVLRFLGGPINILYQQYPSKPSQDTSQIVIDLHEIFTGFRFWGHDRYKLNPISRIVSIGWFLRVLRNTIIYSIDY